MEIEDDEVDVFSEEELARRPEVMFMNEYLLIRGYIRIGLKGTGALALLWATVVLLGGFVSVLNKTDFWCLTIIAFLQAAGLLDAFGDDRFMFFSSWIRSLLFNVMSSEEKHQHEHNFLKRPKRKSRISHFLVGVIFVPVDSFALYAPIICIALSVERLGKQDYGSAHGAASQANLKPALNLFYCVSLVHSAICFFVRYAEVMLDAYMVCYVSKLHGFSSKDLHAYCQETKRMCLNNPASTKNWNLITYGTVLLDSQLPEDYASGVRVVTMLIEQDMPIRRVLILSPRRRIQKLIGALVWRSPVDGETRWLAARIVDHIAGDLNLAQFPGALECVSSLLDTSCHNNGDLDLSRSKKQEERVNSNAAKGRPDFARPQNTVITNGDLILQGLRILENLAHDQHNCTVIYSTKVVDTSLKVASRLMRAPGDTGKDMRRQIADSSNAVGNLEAVLGLQSSSRCILELQMGAMEVLAQLFFHESTSWAGKRREDFIERALHIFLTVECVECYLAEEKKIKIGKETSNQKSKVPWMGIIVNKGIEEMKSLEDKKMKSLEDKKMKAKETASRLKEKAGQALVMLSMGSQSNSEAIRSFTDIVHRLTEMLDCKTIKCRISETETVEAEMKIGCRISAAVILTQLCPHFTTRDDDYFKETTLKKVLVELLHITTTKSQAQEGSTTARTRRWGEHCIALRRNDIENPRDGGQDEHSAVQSHKQQPEERRLRAALLSLCANICARYSIKAPTLATMVAPQISREDFVGNLKKMVEQNSHATPACLAILKLTCHMVEEFILDNQTGEEIIGTLSQIVVKLSEASETMAGVESCMLFAGTDIDCYGVPAKPLLSVLVKKAEERLERRKDGLGINTPAGGGGP